VTVFGIPRTRAWLLRVVPDAVLIGSGNKTYPEG